MNGARHALFVTLVLAVGLCAAQDSTATAPSTGGVAYAADTAIVRAILDSLGRQSVSAASVTREDGGRVVRLDLTNPSEGKEGMKRLPESVCRLDGLQELVLAKNDLTTLPQCLTTMKALRALDAGDNSIVQLPSWIGELKGIERLDLRNNGFAEIPPGLWTLTKLQVLQMWGNRLATLPEDIGKLTSLKQIYLERNRLTMLPKAIIKMPKLEYIDYGYNMLCTLTPEIEAWLKKRDSKYHQLQKCW